MLTKTTSAKENNNKTPAYNYQCYKVFAVFRNVSKSTCSPPTSYLKKKKKKKKLEACVSPLNACKVAGNMLFVILRMYTKYSKPALHQRSAC